jgi:hypothetical protein
MTHERGTCGLRFEVLKNKMKPQMDESDWIKKIKWMKKSLTHARDRSS